jgi:hypothetical protein
MGKSRGRPKIAKIDRRTEGIKLPLSAAEKRSLEAAATAKGSPLAVWVRMVSLEAAGKAHEAIGRE